MQECAKKLVAASILCVVLLSGCSGVEDQAMQYAGISADGDYNQYVELRENGLLDQDGYYQGDSSEVPTAQSGIHVTFAANSYLSIQYYHDAELTDPIDTTACYLEPNDRVYAGNISCKSPYGELYHFDRFRIYSYDSEGGKSEELPWGGGSGNLVLQIPADYTGTELAVEPAGIYEKCTLSLQDYYTDNGGQTQEAGGTWFINGEQAQAQDVEVSPAAACIVDYEYDAAKYEFVSSEPRSFSHENGLVQFETARVSRQNETYSVRLQPIGRELPLKIAMQDSAKDIYLQILSAGSSLDIRYDAGEKTSIRPDWLGGTDRLVFDQQIRMGSELTIAAESGTLVQGRAVKLDVVKTDTDGHEYRTVEYITNLPGQKKVTIYEDDAGANSTVIYKEIRITISKADIVAFETIDFANSSIEIRLADAAGMPLLQPGDPLEASRDVEVRIIPSDGYYVTGSDVKDNVYCKTMSYTKWVSDSGKILEKHPVEKTKSVTLDTSDSFGTCVYKLDGAVVSGTIELREDQNLVLEYTITDANYQIASSGFIGRFQSKTSAAETIPVSEIPDGSTIKRSDYIDIKEK